MLGILGFIVGLTILYTIVQYFVSKMTKDEAERIGWSYEGVLKSRRFFRTKEHKKEYELLK